MGKTCKQCGMQSDRDDLCTWCNADLREAKPKTGPAAPGRPGAAPPTAAPAGPARQPAAAPHSPPARQVATEPEVRERPFWLIPLIAVGGAVVLLVALLLVMGIMASAPPPEPGEWKEFTAKDKSFSAWYPADWGEPSNSGSAGSYVLVDWKAGKLCRVSVQGTQKAGAMGDPAAARERAAGPNPPVDKTADGALLELFKKAFAAKRPGYEEGEAVFSYDFANVRSARADYSYARRVGLLGIKMKGFRLGYFQGDYGYDIYAEAPEKHWAKLEPTAKKILAGVQFGTRG